MKQRINSDEDRSHAPGPEDDEHWQESWFLSWYDPITRIGGLHRVGFQRPREVADVWSWITRGGQLIHKYHSLSLPLPVEDISDVQAGPIHLRSTIPLVEREIAIEHDGFTGHLTYYALSEPFAIPLDVEGAAIAASHYESAGRIEGSVTCPGSDPVAVRAFAFQDHSWGRREWSNILSHRLAWASFGDDFFMCLMNIVAPSGHRQFGYVYNNEKFDKVVSADFSIAMANDGISPLAGDIRAWCESGRGYHLATTIDGSSVNAHRDGFLISDGIGVFECGGRLGTGFLEANELKRPTASMTAELDLSSW